MQNIFRKAGIIYLGILCLWGITACSAVKDVHLKYSGVTATMKQTPVRVTERIPDVRKASEWEEGVRDLVLQLVLRLPVEGRLTVRVGDFREGRNGDKVPLSDLIESDIRTTLALVEDIIVLDQDQVDSDLMLTGIFRRDGEVLRINATMKDMKTGAILAAGRVLIHAGEIHTKDLLSTPVPLNPIPQGEGTEAAPLDTLIEQILTSENSAAPFSVNVWADKDHFRIGESVTFYLKAERDCYVTLLDQGTSGTLRVIFPNPFQRDNFIEAGKTYIIPDPANGYEIRVDGPPGIERVKAIATLRKSDQPSLNVSGGFYEFATQEDGRLRDLNITITQLQGTQWVDGGMKIDILGPDSPEGMRPRSIKPKRPDKPVDIIGTPGAIERDNPGVIEPKRPEKPVDILGVPGVKIEE